MDPIHLPIGQDFLLVAWVIIKVTAISAVTFTLAISAAVGRERTL